MTPSKRKTNGLASGTSLFALAMALQCFGSSAASAQTAAPIAGASDLEEVVVTGSRVIRDGYEAPTPLTVATVTALLAEGEKMVRAGARSLDFSAVTEIDSAAVALVLHLQRVAASLSPSPSAMLLRAVPGAMTNLAGLYGVQELLQPA